MKANPALDILQYAHERAARAAGLPPETRTFRPHVTLARLRGVRERDVATFLQHNGGFHTRPFSVTEFVLYSHGRERAPAVRGGSRNIRSTHRILR